MNNIKHILRKQLISDQNFLSSSQLKEILDKIEKSNNSQPSVTINSDTNDELSSMTKYSIPNLEMMSVDKAQKALQVTPQLDVGVFEKNNVTTPNLSEIPTFHQHRESQRDDSDIAASVVGAIFNPKFKKKYDELLSSEEKADLRKKASEYGIEYNLEDLNFCEIYRKVEDFEELIEEAKYYNIDWQPFANDTISLQEKIDERIADNLRFIRETHWDYLRNTL